MGMARRLEELYQRAKGETRSDLRRKFKLDLNLTDRELFEAYPMSDLFLDAKLHECFFYMYNHCNLQVPDSWDGTMAQFHKELKTADSHLKRSFELLVVMFNVFMKKQMVHRSDEYLLLTTWEVNGTTPKQKQVPKKYILTHLMGILRYYVICAIYFLRC